MRTLALAITILTAVAQAQPTYYARSVAGLSSSGDGGTATAARVFLPSRVTSDAAGNLYVAEAFGRIRKIATDGIITSYASRQDGLANGDNGPAADAGISTLMGMTVSGNFLYLAQRQPCNIRRIDLTTDIITNFAGNGTCAAGSDGVATSTALSFPGALAADRQGRIYVTESAVVRRIDPATGRIDRITGNGTPGFSGDGLPATQATVNGPLGLAIDAAGTIYISDTGNCRIRRVLGTTGIITTIAGSSTCGNSGDGGPAFLAQLSNNGELALDSTGSQLFIASSAPTIRSIQFDTETIERFAGTGLQGPIQNNIPSLQADLRVVSGVHTDSNGTFYFVDFGANRVAKIVNGNLTTVAGGPTFAGDGAPAQYAFLSQPMDVILEPGNRLLISENINRRIRRLSQPGILTTIAGSGAPGPASGNGASALNASVAPIAMFRDNSGNLYLTDALSNAVRVIAPNGAITQVGPTFNSTLGGIAVDAAEQNLYVSLTSEHRVVRISLALNVVTVYAGTSAGFSGDGAAPNLAQLNSPQRLAFDADGNLLIADSGNHRIRRISASGDRIDTVAGNGLSDFSGDGNAATQASLPNPIGLAIDAAGHIIASNAAAIFRVDKFTGKMNRIAGRTTRGNTAALGVPALQASFNAINGIAVDERGVIYFGDQFNLRVVALTPSTLNIPAISGVIAPGSFGAGTTITPGGWVEIYGEKLANGTVQWGTADFNGTTAPTSLGGVRVKIAGREAFVQLASPGQVNAVVPEGVPPGQVTVEVIRLRGPGDTVTSEKVTVIAAERAPYLLAPPAFLRGGKQFAVAILPDGAFVGPQGLVPGANVRPARSGNRVVFYGIGFGAVDPDIPIGTVTISPNALPNVQAKVGGQAALVEYAGLANGYVGLYQFNIQVPSAPAGEVRLEVTVNGQPLAQTLYLALE